MNPHFLYRSEAFAEDLELPPPPAASTPWRWPLVLPVLVSLIGSWLLVGSVPV